MSNFIGFQCNISTYTPQAPLKIQASSAPFFIWLSSHFKSALYLGKCSDSVLTRKQRWIFSNLEVEVHSFVRESRKFIAEAEFVCSIPRCSEGKAIILFFHLFVQHIAIRIFQSTINIIMPSSDHLWSVKDYWHFNRVERYSQYYSYLSTSTSHSI